MANSFQIIGGERRSRKFIYADAEGLRPTPSKVRETLFNWLQFETQGKTFLDLFSGSGALSFEALSRGAKQVVSVEKDTNALHFLEQNKQLLKADNLTIVFPCVSNCNQLNKVSRTLLGVGLNPSASAKINFLLRCSPPII
jgi:16S rRNA (guanine966-N2)-methyltransferase